MKSSSAMKGVRVYVTALNEDGTDASLSVKTSLRELGAAVEDELRQSSTHLVWSNAAPPVAIAAKYLGINVVSPLWVQECVEKKRRVSEDDYKVDVAYLQKMHSRSVATAAAAGVGRVGGGGGLEEPMLLPDFAGLSQPTRAYNRALRQPKPAVGSTKAVSSVRSGRGVGVESPAGAGAGPVIPLPHFRVVEDADESRELTAADVSKRRSVRLIDCSRTTSPAGRSDRSPLSSAFSPAVQTVRGVRPSTVSSASPLSDKNALSGESLEFARSIRPDTKFVLVADLGELEKENRASALPLSTAEAAGTGARGTRGGKRALQPSYTAEGGAAQQAAKKAKTAVPAVKTKISAASSSVAFAAGGGGKNKTKASPKQTSPAACRKQQLKKASSPKVVQVAERKEVAPLAKVSIAMSGFEPEESAMLVTLIEGISGAATGGGGGRQRVVLRSAPADKVSYLVAAENGKRFVRTAKVLFALARGVPVVTTEWLYCSLDGPADPADFRHPRFAKHRLPRAPLRLLSGRRVLLAVTCDLDPKVLRQLVCELGGEVARSVRDADLVLVGDADDGDAAVEAFLRDTGAISAMADREAFARLARDCKMLRVKFLFDCVELGEWKARPSPEYTVALKMKPGSPAVPVLAAASSNRRNGSNKTKVTGKGSGATPVSKSSSTRVGFGADQESPYW